MTMLLLLALLCFCVLARALQYGEELLLRPLPSGAVHAHFHFRNRRRTRDTPSEHDVFPKAIAEIVETYAVDELLLTLTQGRWRRERWGVPVSAAPVRA